MTLFQRRLRPSYFAITGIISLHFCGRLSGSSMRRISTQGICSDRISLHYMYCILLKTAIYTAGMRDSGISRAYAAGLGGMVPGQANPCAGTPEFTCSRLGTRLTQPASAATSAHGRGGRPFCGPDTHRDTSGCYISETPRQRYPTGDQRYHIMSVSPECISGPQSLFTHCHMECGECLLAVPFHCDKLTLSQNQNLNSTG